MAKNSLVIVESPAKAKTIGKYLGKDFEVKACMGHLRDLPKSNIGVDIENDFEPVYQPIKGKEETIGDLKKSAKAAATVYLATDPDREGEASSWHLKHLLDLDDENWKFVDGWWYYLNSVKGGAATAPLFTTVTFDPSMGNEFQGSTAVLNLVAQATQKANNGTDALTAAGWPAE